VAGNRTSLRLTFQAGGKNEAHDWIVMRVDHHLVPKVSDVLNWIIHSGVVVESGNREFPQEFTPLDLFGGPAPRLGLHDPLLD